MTITMDQPVTEDRLRAIKKPHIFHQWYGWWCVDAKDDCWLVFGGATKQQAYQRWLSYKEDLGDLDKWFE